jgi:capsular exopolysaccharide synthesis family protein
VINLDLTVDYFTKNKLLYHDGYKSVPIKILLLKNHIQPFDIKFHVLIKDKKTFFIQAEGKDVLFLNLYTGTGKRVKEHWSFSQTKKFGDLIENEDLAFIVKLDSTVTSFIPDQFIYGFSLKDVESVTYQIKNQLDFSTVDRDATVIEISLKSSSSTKGIDILNEIMDVYSTQNVNRKNHIANVTIDYIERQLGEISDSLSQTEDNLQQFRSSRQLLDVSDQSAGMSEQYMSLQNQMAELVTRKRYYDYLNEFMSGSRDFTNMIVPSAMGIQDEVLNNLVSQLINAQSQRANLIRNGQEKNPLVQRLQIQIENSKKTISANISAVAKTTEISIDEMNKRINRIKSDISRVPKTQRQLSGIQRNYRLNDAIYNYLLEKRAEAKISQASNLPDNTIIEPAKLVGMISPLPKKNYIFALILAIIFPFGFLFLKSIMGEKIEYQTKIGHLTNAPILGKIPHTRKKTNDIVFQSPKSSIAEAYRALRTNIEYRFKETQHKVILISSSIEGEGKSFTALNLAMSYAQLGKKTILIDLDIRKPTGYFNNKVIAEKGITSYLMNMVIFDELVQTTAHEKLFYIPSGPIPPNPVELLASEDVKKMIADLKEQYQCIIIDTSPLAQVADAYLLLDYADIKVIVARYNHTIKRVFHLIMEDLNQKKIENIVIVMNDNKVYNDQYGYGYGYESKKKSLFKLKSVDNNK